MEGFLFYQYVMQNSEAQGLKCGIPKPLLSDFRQARKPQVFAAGIIDLKVFRRFHGVQTRGRVVMRVIERKLQETSN